jgi:hypothetical protein
MMGEELRTRYWSAMQAADLPAVLALFAEDAVVVLPDGIEHKGKPALKALFANILANRPSPSPGPITGGGDYWAAEVETITQDGGKRNTANFFRLNGDGLVASMHGYRRG